jgi:hypothetical protein
MFTEVLTGSLQYNSTTDDGELFHAPPITSLLISLRTGWPIQIAA